MSEVWILMANDDSDVGIISVHATHEGAAAAKKELLKHEDLNEEDIWIEGREVEL